MIKIAVKISLILLAGFLLEKKVGVNQPKRLENARILIANTAMDTDKIKVFGSKVSESLCDEVVCFIFFDVISFCIQTHTL